MSERKIEIIDKTIIVLKEIYGDKFKQKIPEIKEFIKLLYIIGSDFIEITQELYEELSPLPQNIRFIISNNNNVEIQNANEFYNSLISKSNLCNLKNARVTGLDDIIFYDYEKVFFEITNAFGTNIQMCIKNKYGASTAMSLEWIKLGGKRVITTFAGIGGYAPLEEILGALSFLEKIKLRGNHKLLPKVLNLFEDITESKLRGDMPFIGKDIFNVESGIHVNGISKNPSTYEPYDPSAIGRKRIIIIGKHSGMKSLEIKLKELNIKYDSSDLNCMLEDVRRLSTKNRRGLNDKEIEEIYKKCSI
ncbi:hypothetical protein psyc5s11_35430 [Clostridium gelidum]|uniref:2-isopropylmalate synthase/homocitrate synthase post-catalytic domain-containing protein n=1 Tax=Clostridium gelidum TaxID=704125 RepID=A0ABN6J3A2_9CLOT|nr:isopropylmalate synthase [Clostridium gelidum]BCZ47476.1 hypothetical protein psyc5s11_35430 [Clostridium gelidum]